MYTTRNGNKHEKNTKRHDTKRNGKQIKNQKQITIKHLLSNQPPVYSSQPNLSPPFSVLHPLFLYLRLPLYSFISVSSAANPSFSFISPQLSPPHSVSAPPAANTHRSPPASSKHHHQPHFPSFHPQLPTSPPSFYRPLFLLSRRHPSLSIPPSPIASSPPAITYLRRRKQHRPTSSLQPSSQPSPPSNLFFHFSKLQITKTNMSIYIIDTGKHRSGLRLFEKLIVWPEI